LIGEKKILIIQNKKKPGKSHFCPYFPYLDFARKEDIGVGTSSKAKGSQGRALEDGSKGLLPLHLGPSYSF
jgi:hypothetical protein